jgi:hypothetical protein
MHQGDGLDGNFRLVEELQLLAALGAIRLGNASGMGRDALVFVDRLRRRRENFAQVHLRGIGFGSEALALLSKELPAKPLELVFQRCDLLSLRTHDDGKLPGAQRTHFGEVG